MSYYRMHRRWQENDAFGRDEFSRRDAWIWLIENAAFAADKGVDRGQIRISLRGLATVWRWQEPRVRRCLANFRERRMIDCVADASGTLITVCNYDVYQADPETPTHHVAGDRRAVGSVGDAQYKEGKKEEEDSVPIGTRQSARQITEWMVEVWKEVFGSALTIPTRHNDNRIKTARARFVGDFRSDIGEWRKYLERIQLCPWLMGSKGWKADFDWVLKPSNLTKVLEGRYDIHAKSNGNASGSNELPFGGGPPGPAPTLEELKIRMERPRH